MRHIKSERLKKLESELHDLEDWLKLGLVPKKDIEKHKEEIRSVLGKIEEEKERLQFLKESGEAEEYITPKRPSARTGYTELPTIPDIDIGETAMGGMGDSNIDVETDAIDVETTEVEDREEGAEEDEGESEKTVVEEEDEESPFSDRNRWRRGGILDPDADEW